MIKYYIIILIFSCNSLNKPDESQKLLELKEETFFNIFINYTCPAYKALLESSSSFKDFICMLDTHLISESGKNTVSYYVDIIEGTTRNCAYDHFQYRLNEKVNYPCKKLSNFFKVISNQNIITQGIDLNLFISKFFGQSYYIIYHKNERGTNHNYYLGNMSRYSNGSDAKFTWVKIDNNNSFISENNYKKVFFGINNNRDLNNSDVEAFINKNPLS